MVFTFSPCAPDSPLDKREMPFDVVLQFVWECHKSGYVGVVSFLICCCFLFKVSVKLSLPILKERSNRYFTYFTFIHCWDYLEIRAGCNIFRYCVTPTVVSAVSFSTFRTEVEERCRTWEPASSVQVLADATVWGEALLSRNNRGGGTDQQKLFLFWIFLIRRHIHVWLLVTGLVTGSESGSFLKWLNYFYCAYNLYGRGLRPL